MQKSIIAAAAASVLAIASAGFAQTTLVNENFDGGTVAGYPTVGDPITGTTAVQSNPDFSPAPTPMQTQENIEIIAADADFNAFFGSQSVDVNSRGIDFAFTVPTGQPNVTVSFDYGIDNQGGAPHGPRSPIFAIATGSVNVVGPVTVSPAVLSTAAAPDTASFANTYTLVPGTAYTLSLSTDSALDLRGVQYDNVLVTSVPEPASLGLLGLGGLALLRRRRA